MSVISTWPTDTGLITDCTRRRLLRELAVHVRLYHCLCSLLQRKFTPWLPPGTLESVINVKTF